jgi:hypothetical protein
MHDSPHQKAGDHKQGETIIVKGPGKKLDLVVAFERKPQNIHARHAHAAVASGEMIELEQERVEQHAKGKRQHAKENSHVARAEERNGQCDQGGSNDHSEKHDFELLDSDGSRHHRGTIGAKTEKHGVTKRQQPCVAKQKIKAEQCDGISEERDHQPRVVRRHDVRQ